MYSVHKVALCIIFVHIVISIVLIKQCEMFDQGLHTKCIIQKWRRSNTDAIAISKYFFNTNPNDSEASKYLSNSPLQLSNYNLGLELDGGQSEVAKSPLSQLTFSWGEVVGLPLATKGGQPPMGASTYSNECDARQQQSLCLHGGDGRSNSSVQCCHVPITTLTPLKAKVVSGPRRVCIILVRGTISDFFLIKLTLSY